ncbi:MAG: phosphoenolpyruvate carboxylase [Conexivisphaerales archaeon]
MRLIPRSMATQHPDNARVPNWIRGTEIIASDDEVYEAYISYSEFGAEEVMWDAEGKDVDTHVVRKLFTDYPEHFRDNILGKDQYLTYRVPNPSIEGADRKVFAETLESIPITFDVAEKFYGESVTTPVFEVILPFTTSSEELIALANYYEKVVVNKEDTMLTDSISVKGLIGEFRPKKIEIIPLIEDMDSMLNIKTIVGKYISAFNVPYLRAFIARSDPAMNYGMLPAVLLSKYALADLNELSVKYNIEIFPIIGVGSLPFRGHFNPRNVKNSLEEYRGVWTFTVQSAFRYDYPKEEVKDAIRYINMSKAVEPELFSDYEKQLIKKIVSVYRERYQTEIEGLAPIINEVADFVPRRRARKLHIGLFGYSRSTGNVILPRAITFVASLYTIGIPPEIIGLSSLANLNEQEWNFVTEKYKYLKEDLREASKYLNMDSLDMLESGFNLDKRIIELVKEDVLYMENQIGIKVPNHQYDIVKHRLFSSLALTALIEKKDSEVKMAISEMAAIRNSLG